MESRGKLLGHPIYPMLIVLPFGLFITAEVFDALHLWRGSATFAPVRASGIEVVALGPGRIAG